VVALKAHADLEVISLGLLGRREHLADAGGVDGDGLLHEHVLAGLDGGLEVDRAEAGRGGEDDDVRARLEHALEAVEPGEDAILGDVDLL
jgi:hypothetical protein